MSILVKGMEMPESCYYCPFADGVWQKDKRCLINGEEMPRDGRDVQQNHINCPLVEVPTPHGDLIDRDALRDNNCDVFEINGADGTILAMDVSIIDDAPIIIPAEEGET